MWVCDVSDSQTRMTSGVNSSQDVGDKFAGIQKDHERCSTITVDQNSIKLVVKASAHDKPNSGLALGIIIIQCNQTKRPSHGSLTT